MMLSHNSLAGNPRAHQLAHVLSRDLSGVLCQVETPAAAGGLALRPGLDDTRALRQHDRLTRLAVTVVYLVQLAASGARDSKHSMKFTVRAERHPEQPA